MVQKTLFTENVGAVNDLALRYSCPPVVYFAYVWPAVEHIMVLSCIVISERKISPLGFPINFSIAAFEERSQSGMEQMERSIFKVLSSLLGLLGFLFHVLCFTTRCHPWLSFCCVVTRDPLTQSVWLVAEGKAQVWLIILITGLFSSNVLWKWNEMNNTLCFFCRHHIKVYQKPECSLSKYQNKKKKDLLMLMLPHSVDVFLKRHKQILVWNK